MKTLPQNLNRDIHVRSICNMVPSITMVLAHFSIQNLFTQISFIYVTESNKAMTKIKLSVINANNLPLKFIEIRYKCSVLNSHPMNEFQGQKQFGKYFKTAKNLLAFLHFEVNDQQWSLEHILGFEGIFMFETSLPYLLMNPKHMWKMIFLCPFRNPWFRFDDFRVRSCISIRVWASDSEVSRVRG